MTSHTVAISGREIPFHKEPIRRQRMLDIVVARDHKGTFTYYVIIYNLNNFVPFRHKDLWRPLGANRGSRDLKDVVAYGQNQL